MTEKSKQEPMAEESKVSEEQPSQPVNNRKKRSWLPSNIDDYEKRRSARSVSRA